MAQGESWLAKNQTVICTVPVDTTGAALTTEYVNMGEYNRCIIQICTGAWAGGTMAITINEATDASASGATALAFSKYFTNVAGALPTETTATSNTFNVGTANTLYQIEITADMLSDGFDFIAVAGASPGANTDLVYAQYIMCEPRTAAAPGSQLNATD